jgi:hypothetical protein
MSKTILYYLFYKICHPEAPEGLIVFKKRVLRRIFDPKREGTGVERNLYNEELHNLFG